MSMPIRPRTCALAFAPALLAVAGCTAAEQAETPAEQLADETQATREVAMQFLQQAFIDGDFRGAYDRFAKPDFIQHNPMIADGLEGHRAYFAELAKQSDGKPADWAHVSDLVLVDGDVFAFVHHRFRAPDQPGQVFVDLWRVEDGKIAEHWDVVQDIPAQMPHDNGMACGVGETWESAKAHADSITQTACDPPDPDVAGKNSVSVYRDYTGEVGKGDVLAAIEKWFHPDYRQHSPVIADGKQGAIDYLQMEWGRKDAPKPVLGEQRIVADGDYVLVHYLFGFEGSEEKEAHVDIFRMKDGLVYEHWDFKQKVPETSANDNGMW